MTARVLICGSRSWTDSAAVRQVIDALPDGAAVIHGGAAGADGLAGRFAAARGLTVEVYPADWRTYGRAAGPIRNAQMLREGRPDRVIAFRMCGISRGTDNMIRQARVAGVPVEVVESVDRASEC